MPFVGLEGIKKKQIDGKFVGSPAAAIRALNDNRVASLAGDRGAVTVWRDDAGVLHGEFSQFGITQSTLLTKSKAELRRWLDRVAPQCE